VRATGATILKQAQVTRAHYFGVSCILSRG
jgi:hypothetical protein